MKALWLELGDSAITAIPIHFMAWSDKFATGRLEKYPLMMLWTALRPRGRVISSHGEIRVKG